MIRISHVLFFWLPRFRNKTPILQLVMNIMVGVGVICAAVGVIFFIQRRIDRRVAITREKLLLLRAIEQRQEVFVNLSNDYKRLTPVFSAVYSIIPHAEDVIMFASTMETAAKETGNTIAFQFETDEPTSDPVFAAIAHVKFHIKIEGTGDSLNRFLKLLEVSRYLHNIDTISIEGKDGIYGAITATMKGTVFIQKISI